MSMWPYRKKQAGLEPTPDPEPIIRLLVRMTREADNTEWRFDFDTEEERGRALENIRLAMAGVGSSTVTVGGNVTLRSDLIASVQVRNTPRRLYGRNL